MKFTMLIVEDDEGLQSSLKRSFERREYEVLTVSTAYGASSLLKERNIDLLLLDIWLPDGSGLDVLTMVHDLEMETAVIIMTAFPDVKTAVHAMKEGASDFIMKPFELEELHLTVERVIETRTLRRNVRLLERERKGRCEIRDILGESSAIEQVRELIRKVADSDVPVLVTGETGTGKELVVDAIHCLSSRSKGPLVKVNCSAFSEPLLESELFGHVKGAFTDAKEARTGLFEMANGGTILLDEISEMKPDLQAKLLRIVEGQPFRRVGGQQEVRADTRVVTSTNRDLPANVRSGSFREDLFFRLNAFQINVPPLRARGADIVMLARFFLQYSAETLRKGSIRLMPEVEDILLAYDWPGNVRELRNMMERAVILCETGEVSVDHLPGEIQVSTFIDKQFAKNPNAMPSLSEIEHRYVFHVVRSVGDNLAEAMRILGISRNTLKTKLREYEDSSSEVS